MHESIAHIHKNADLLRQQAQESDELGKLTEDTVRVLKESGGIRLLQAKDSGGFEEHPNVFFEWVRAVAQYSPSAGWIAGVVGVHPWEIALMDRRLQEEIYGEDPTPGRRRRTPRSAGPSPSRAASSSPRTCPTRPVPTSASGSSSAAS